MKKIVLAITCVITTSVLSPKIYEAIKRETGNKENNKLSLSVYGTYYNPVVGQCDSDPLVTASNDKISLKKLKEKKIRWIACSRDLLKRWGGKLSYGDKVHVVSENKNIAGIWHVKDTMNKRYKNRVDFLCLGRIRGEIGNIKIIKI